MGGAVVGGEGVGAALEVDAQGFPGEGLLKNTLA